MWNALATFILMIVRELLSLLSRRPADRSITNEELELDDQRARKADAQAEQIVVQAEELQWREEKVKMREREAIQKEHEAMRREAKAHRRERETNLAAEQAGITAREREAYILKREEEAAEQARLELEQAILQCEESEKREKEAKEKEEEAKRLAGESKQAALDAQKRELEANARVLESQKREAEARKREEQVKKDLQQTKFYLERGIQPEVWPTDEEFQLAKKRVQYDPEKLHFVVCGSSGSGKSSLINAFRGLKNNSPQAALTGVVQTTMTITRYPDPHDELPYKRFVWFDCPGAGTLEIPGWQYFNQQGLFIFDIIILVYDSRFTQIDVSIIQNCERFKIPLFIVRSKADIHIKNIMQDLGYGENDEDADDDFDDYQRRAQQLLIDNTRKNLEDNLKKAELNKHDVFIVSGSVIFSLVTAKGHKKTTPPIDEERLMEIILKMAQARRYRSQTSAKNHLTPPVTDNVG